MEKRQKMLKNGQLKSLVDFTECKGGSAFKTVYFEFIFKVDASKVNKKELTKRIRHRYLSVYKTIDREIFMPSENDIFIIDSGADFDLWNGSISKKKKVIVSLYLHSSHRGDRKKPYLINQLELPEFVEMKKYEDGMVKILNDVIQELG